MERDRLLNILQVLKIALLAAACWLFFILLFVFGCQAQKPTKPPPNKTFDVVFISDKYNDYNIFFADAQVCQDAILSQQPFKARQSQVTFTKVATAKPLHCNSQDGFYWCDIKAIKRILKADYELIVVLSFQDGQGMSGRGAGGMVVIRIDHFWNWQPVLKYIMPHEMGHASFGFIDEYTYPAVTQTYGDIYKNCYRDTLQPYPAAWANIVGKEDYVRGCYSMNWMAPGRSIMHSQGLFNAPCQQVIGTALNNITGGFTDSQLPQAAIIHPPDGAQVDSTDYIYVVASDNTGVTFVRLLVNGVYTKTLQSEPYIFSIPKQSGVLNLKAVAVDCNWNEGTSLQITVTK